MKNDRPLFVRADQVEAVWRLLMPVVQVWATVPPGDFPNYAAGSWGPEETQGLLASGHSWPFPTGLSDVDFGNPALNRQKKSTKRKRRKASSRGKHLKRG